MIIHRGTLTIEKLKELATKHGFMRPAVVNSTAEYNPELNANAISIIKQEDGNYKGFMQKHGAFIEVRQVDPLTVLMNLLTHP